MRRKGINWFSIILLLGVLIWPGRYAPLYAKARFLETKKARRYKPEGYWYFDMSGRSFGFPWFSESHTLKGAIGYGPLLVGTELEEWRKIPGTKESVISMFPLCLNLIIYGKVYPKTSYCSYLYARGNKWRCHNSQKIPASYFDAGIGFLTHPETFLPKHWSESWVGACLFFLPVDFRLGYFAGNIESEGGLQNTIYASLGYGMGLWNAYGVKEYMVKLKPRYEKANKLFLEASRMVESGREAEKTSYREASKLYKKALKKLETITRKFASSHIASEILSGRLKIGPYTLDQLNYRSILVSVLAEAMPVAEKDVLACATVVASKIRGFFGSEFQSNTYCRIAVKYAMAGEYKRAFQLAILAEAIPIETMSFGTVYFVRGAFCRVKIASEYARQKKFTRALRLVKTMKRSPERCEALSSIASEYANDGKYKKALRIAKLIEGPYWRAKALVGLARKYEEIGKRREVVYTLSEALQLIEPNYYSVDVAPEQRGLAVDIAARYVEAGEYKRAFEISQKMPNQYGKDEVLAQIVEGYANQGKFSEGLEAVQTIESLYWKAKALVMIANKYVRTGQKDAAIGMVGQALKVIEKKGIDEDDYADVLVEIAGVYIKLDQKDKAIEILSKIFGLFTTGDLSIPKCAIRNRMVDLYMQADEDGLIHRVRAIEGPMIKDDLMLEIANRYVQMEKNDQAMAMLSQVRLIADTIQERSESGFMDIWGPPADIIQCWLSIAYAKLGRYEKALHAITDIGPAGLKAKALTEIGSKYARMHKRVSDDERKILHEIIVPVQ